MEPIGPNEEFDSWRMSWREDFYEQTDWNHPDFNKELFLAMAKAIMDNMSFGEDSSFDEDGIEPAEEYPEALALIMNAYNKFKKITP